MATAELKQHPHAAEDMHVVTLPRNKHNKVHGTPPLGVAHITSFLRLQPATPFLQGLLLHSVVQNY